MTDKAVGRIENQTNMILTKEFLNRASDIAQVPEVYCELCGYKGWYVSENEWGDSVDVECENPIHYQN